MIGIGRQGFVGDSGSAVAPHVPVAWIGQWVEAYFADNNTQFATDLPNNYPYMYGLFSTGFTRQRPTILGANTTEQWEYFVADIVNNRLQSQDPNVIWNVAGAYVLNYQRVFGTPIAYGQWASITVADPLAGSARRIDVASQFTVGIQALIGIPSGVIHIALHTGTVTNLTTGASITAVNPVVNPTATVLPNYQRPVTYGTLTVADGDVVEISAGTITGINWKLDSGLRPYTIPAGNNGFDLYGFDYPYARPTDTVVTKSYTQISDLGSPTSLHGFVWSQAIYPDAPAYKLEYDFTVQEQGALIMNTWQGTGINSSFSFQDGGIATGHRNTPLLNPTPLVFNIGTVNSISHSLRPLNALGEWEVIMTLNGATVGTAVIPVGGNTNPYSSTLDDYLGYMHFNTDSKHGLSIKNIRMSYWERV